MAGTSGDNSTDDGPPVQTGSGVSGAFVAVEVADSAQLAGAQTIALQQLVRIVAALPLHQFMPLNHAFVRAKNCLGAGGIAAHDLWQHARCRRLTIAARRILPDGTEQVVIFRPKFWQYFAILPPDSIRPGVARIRAAYGWAPLLIGDWYAFVGRRRFDRCYSTAAPSKPAVQAPAPSILLTSENPRGAGPSASPEPPPAPQQVTAGGQSKSPEAPSPKEPQTLEKWLPWAETRWPKEKQAVDDYDEFLLGKAPKRWKKHSLQTTRSNLKKQAREKQRR